MAPDMNVPIIDADAVEGDGLHPADIENMDSLYTVLADVPFPITKQDLLSHMDKERVNWSEDQTASLSGLVKALPDQTFASLSDLSAALGTLTPQA